MVKVELRATNLSYIQQRMTALRRGLTGPYVQAAMMKRGTLIQRRAQELAPVATGKLKKSIYVRGTATEKDIYVRVGSDLFYAIYVEEGTPPHMPPVSAIAAWVRIKNLVGSNPRRIIQRRGLRFERTNQEMRLAWAIAKKIEKRGTKGQHFFRRAERDTREEGAAYVMRAVEHTIRQNWGN